LVPRGVTLLELLIVLTLMGIAAAVVAPSFGARSATPEASRSALVTSARRMAVRRAERLSLRLSQNGAWSVRTLTDGAVLDSGHVRDALPDAELLLDALGGCVPARGTSAGEHFDPLTCTSAARVVSP
jgi:prepilin-type N-terminal cleavage/methylation domain-containing protein